MERNRIYVLKHIETPEFICLLKDGTDYLCAFTNGDDAYDFRAQIGQVEFIDVASVALSDVLFTHFWLDGVLKVGEPVEVLS